VNIPPANCNPNIRFCTTAWELTSMHAYSHPSSTISANNLFSVTGSGVVRCAGTTRSSTLFSIVDINPAFFPNARSARYSSVATVVFPLVPVTPISFNFSLGRS